MITNPSKDYARGFVPFLGCTIFLDSHPFIPRSETEFWVEKFIQKNRKSLLKILDLFAGSGCVGIAVLKHLPAATVGFGEIEERHSPTIEKSLRENGIDTARTRIFKTDVWSEVTGRYDCILANPPYVARDSRNIDTSVVEHEPHEALFADNDGFALIKKTITGAKVHLNPQGELWVEHDPEHAERLAELGAQLGFTVETHVDQYGLFRYSVMA